MTKEKLKKPNKQGKGRWKFTCTGVKIIVAILVFYLYAGFWKGRSTEDWRLAIGTLFHMVLLGGVFLFCEIKQRTDKLKKRIDKLEKQLQEEKDK